MFKWFSGMNVGGDVVGRDKITTILQKPTQMDILNDLYKQEVLNQDETNNIIDELHHYNNNSQASRDLSTKLRSSGFDYILDEAEELKELVSKIIIKNQNYQSAQRIITLLLSNVESIFNASIKPRLHNINDEARLKQILRTYLELEVQEMLGENVLCIYHRQINGMIFFLTGNCHIEWE